MRWISRLPRVAGQVTLAVRPPRSASIPVVLLFLFLALRVPAAAPEKRLSIYSTAANYSLPIVQREGRDYVGLLEVLDPLGTVSAKSDPPRWRIHYNNILGDFTQGSGRARIQGRDADLAGRFILESGRGFVPLASLASILPRFLGGPVTLHEESGRLFVGSVATRFTASISPSDASSLVFHFTSPVNPTIASEPGKLRMTFLHEPVTAPASPTLTFGSKIIPSSTYTESNGAAQIIVSSTVPLFASFSNDGRTVTLTPARSQAASSTSAATTTAKNVPTPPAAQNLPLALPVVNPPSPAPRRYFAIVDASHGGNDRGEAL